MMGDIYRGTRQCIVWLGKAGENTYKSGLAFRLFRGFETKWKEAYRELHNKDPTTYVLNDERMMEALNKSHAKDNFVDMNVDME